MIGYLCGVVKEVTEETALVVVGSLSSPSSNSILQGVGYELFMSSRDLSDLESEIACETVLHPREFWIYTHVREDALTLFGFLVQKEKSFFMTLLKINGVGPKLAMNILGGGTLEQIYRMIEAEDLKSLTKLPKVGKKTAEQMILALKGKLVLSDADASKGSETSERRAKPERSELFSTLLNLGYREADIAIALRDVPESLTLQEGVRRSLQILSQGLNI